MKTKRFTVCILLSVLVFAISVTSCKTKKEIGGTRNIHEATEVFAIVVNNSLEYKTFSGKLKTTLRKGKTNIDVSASLKIIKDDKLLLSFQVPLLGEMFKLGISKDSILIVDRFNKQYVSESMKNIKEATYFDFNIYNLQSLFTNQLFLGGKPCVTEKDFRLFTIDQSQKLAIIKTKEKHQQIDYSFSVDYTDHIRNTSMIGNNGKTAMNWAYSNFSAPENNNQLFPMQMNINLTNKENKFSMNFTFSKIELDKNIEIDLNVPKKYTRISMEQAVLLIKSLQE